MKTYLKSFISLKMTSFLLKMMIKWLFEHHHLIHLLNILLTTSTYMDAGSKDLKMAHA